MHQSEGGTERCLRDLGLIIKCDIAVLIVPFAGKGGDVEDFWGVCQFHHL